QVLLRNNESIHPQYRFQFPFWIYSNKETDAGFNELVAAAEAAGFGAVPFVNFWERLTTNSIITPDIFAPPMNISMIGETYIKSINDFEDGETVRIDTDDITNYSFSIPL